MRQIEYVDKPVQVPVRVYPPGALLIPCQPDIINLKAGATWGDLIHQSLERKFELEKCSERMNAIINWVGDSKRIDRE